jgi:hypothetical protein
MGVASYAPSGLAPALVRPPGLAPWAAFCRRFAAAGESPGSIWVRATTQESGCDGSQVLLSPVYNI